MTIGSRQKLRAIDNRITVKINDLDINRVNSVKSLGVYIDDHLWTTHIDKISKKIASAIGALKPIRPYIPTNTAVQVYQALIQPHFDYCCSVWNGLRETLCCKLQKLQNRAAREKLKAGLMFKTLNGNMPSYLKDMFSVRGTGYNMRNSDLRLNLPKP